MEFGIILDMVDSEISGGEASSNDSVLSTLSIGEDTSDRLSLPIFNSGVELTFVMLSLVCFSLVDLSLGSVSVYFKQCGGDFNSP